jgi:hypothetical protein
MRYHNIIFFILTQKAEKPRVKQIVFGNGLKICRIYLMIEIRFKKDFIIKWIPSSATQWHGAIIIICNYGNGYVPAYSQWVAPLSNPNAINRRSFEHSRTLRKVILKTLECGFIIKKSNFRCLIKKN